jgi:restriction system protein
LLANHKEHPLARRRRTSPAEDVLEIVSMLPWWAGVLLAAVAYVTLRSFASQPLGVAAQPAQIGSMLTQSMWKALAGVGQYAVPILCIAGAAISAMQRKRRTDLVADVAQSKAADALDGMSWREFEMLVGEGFRLQGYKVLEVGGGGADGGVDLVLTKPGRNGAEKFLVQCKQWRAFKVGVDVVRELYGVMAALGATGGFVVTSGRFTDEALGFASGRNVTLVDGPKLRALIQQARQSDGVRMREQPARSGATIADTASSDTDCPLCSKPMIRRIAKRGANAGGAFWGCTAYPTCRGTRPIA